MQRGPYLAKFAQTLRTKAFEHLVAFAFDRAFRPVGGPCRVKRHLYPDQPRLKITTSPFQYRLLLFPRHRRHHRKVTLKR
nr:hypothetical protein [Salipiger aestuarii]